MAVSPVRARRHARADASQIREHAIVVGSDGTHVGTVAHLKNGNIKLTKNDAEAGGLHHSISIDFVQSVERNRVRLSRSADAVRREWSTSGAA
ncbi:DUF2171 domain-containing protein [Methylobacterium radiodurans]|uniref:DUF2171 domain-containing protein n=1 Tax=Methylobacterium radiodurans TaxID=2202828 RepID=UPI001FE51D39|nr:DUF2171 domain-containing protein [Methylobacterium radiodurans]